MSARRHFCLDDDCLYRVLRPPPTSLLWLQPPEGWLYSRGLLYRAETDQGWLLLPCNRCRLRVSQMAVPRDAALVGHRRLPPGAVVQNEAHHTIVRKVQENAAENRPKDQ